MSKIYMKIISINYKKKKMIGRLPMEAEFKKVRVPKLVIEKKNLCLYMYQLRF
jgi:hypothetical protein